jgi:CheY-like chemotaxis protein
MSQDVEDSNVIGSERSATRRTRRRDGEGIVSQRAAQVRRVQADVAMRMFRIVVIDDEELMLNTVARCLRQRRRRWDVRTTRDPVEALSIVLSGGADLLITDLRMPTMSGTELIRWVHAEAPYVRTLVLTGDADAVEYLAEVVDAVVTKPFRAELLCAAIERALDAEPSSECHRWD